ncbi:MAG: nitroreductase family protein [Promethearchaeota archaeon]
MTGESKPSNNFLLFTQIAQQRRSYKIDFSNKKVPLDLVKRCVDVARWAPSAHNSQPWRYIAFLKQEKEHQALRVSMVNKMLNVFSRDLEKDGIPSERIKSRIDASRKTFINAPVLLIACMDSSVLDKYSDLKRQQHEFIMGTQSLAASIQILLLTMESIGLKACWYCAPLFCQEIIKNLLKLPDSWHPQAFITSGFSLRENDNNLREDEKKKREKESVHNPAKKKGLRHPLDDILFFPNKLEIKTVE